MIVPLIVLLLVWLLFGWPTAIIIGLVMLIATAGAIRR